MEYSQSQLSEIREDFGRRRRRLLIVVIALAFFMVVSTFILRSQNPDYMRQYDKTVTIVVLILGAGMAVFSHYNWRCPGCRRYLGRGWNPRFCRGCGVQLRE